MGVMIKSTHNQRLRELRKLHERKHRERTGLFMAEGEDMLAEALRHGMCPRAVFYDAEELQLDDPLLAELPAGVDRVAVQGNALRSAGSLGSGSRVIGIWEQRWSTIDRDLDVALYLHEVSDPGNVGAVLRSALALVPSIVLLSPRTADPFGPKAVRASMGAIFGQPVARASFEQARERLGDGRHSVALLPRNGRLLRELTLGRPVLFCLGSERLGLPERIVDACDEVGQVPLLFGGAESLNVAMTATLCLYESAVHRLSGADE
jgi:TrmH family RNA methyltransferase